MIVLNFYLRRNGMSSYDISTCNIYLRCILQEGILKISDFNASIEADIPIDYLETWRGMEECVHQGLVRSIGISNFNSEQIIRLLKSAKIAPVNNQVSGIKSFHDCIFSVKFVFLSELIYIFSINYFSISYIFSKHF